MAGTESSIEQKFIDRIKSLPIEKVSTNDLAEILLKSVNPLEILTQIVGFHHVGDETSIKIHILSIISACSDYKVHLYMSGRAGHGKSHLQETILNHIIPLQNRYEAERVSPKALFYRAKPKKVGFEQDEKGNNIKSKPIFEIYDFRKKIILLDDARPEDAELVKALGTQTIPSYETVVNGKAELLKLNGIPVIWFNKVTPITDEDGQIPSRYYYLNIDESEQQENDMKTFQLKKATEKEEDKKSRVKLDKLARSMINHILQNDKSIYIVPEILKNTPTRAGRDTDIFIGLLKAYTLLNQYQRTQIDNQVLAEQKDFDYIKNLWSNQDCKLDDTSKFILANCLPNIEPSDDMTDYGFNKEYTIIGIAECYNQKSKKKLGENMIRIKLKSLYDSGLIHNKKIPGSRAYYYWI